MNEIPFRIEWLRGSLFRFQNVTLNTINNVTAEPIPEAVRADNLPVDRTFRPNESIEIFVIGSAQTGTPRQVFVSWDTQIEPVAIPIPEKR